MSSINNSFDERVNNITIGVNAVIQYKLDAGIINEEDANVLRDMLIRIRTNLELLKVIIDFNESFLAMNNIYMNERVNNITIGVNAITQYKRDTGTITEEDANVLRDILIRIQTYVELLNAIIDFNEFCLAMNAIWASNTFATSSTDITCIPVTYIDKICAACTPVTYVDKICANIIGAVVFVILLLIMMINPLKC